MIEKITNETKAKMDKVIDDLKTAFSKIRTGRASMSILDDIIVPFYGIDNHVNQLATLSIPESRMIVIQPWDAGAIAAIEKAILKSDLGVTPSNDGKVIRLNMPQLTEERRKEMVKAIKKRAEEHKISVRNIRKKSNEEIKKELKDKTLTEDESFKLQKDIQDLTDGYEKKIAEIEKHKEQEIMEI